MKGYVKKNRDYVKGKTRLTPMIKSHVLHMISKYHELKALTRIQNSDLAEDTDRYGRTLKWYQLIRETLEEWRTVCPENAAIISEVYGIGERKVPITVQRSAMEHHYAVSTVYHLREEFAYDIGVKAVRDGLIFTG